MNKLQGLKTVEEMKWFHMIKEEPITHMQFTFHAYRFLGYLKINVQKGLLQQSNRISFDSLKNVI